MINFKKFVNSRFTSNTYIIYSTEQDSVWIVDPGDTDAVFAWMSSHSKTSIAGILLTHAHFDHIYGINEILSRYQDCSIYTANDYGREVLSDPRKNGSKYIEQGPTVIKDNALVMIYPTDLMLWNVIPLRVFYTPGHSDDSVCFIIGTLFFTGDTLIKDVRTVTKLKTGSREKLMETISLLKTFKGRGLLVCPGHGETFEFDTYELNNSVVMKSQI